MITLSMNIFFFPSHAMDKNHSSVWKTIACIYSVLLVITGHVYTSKRTENNFIKGKKLTFAINEKLDTIHEAQLSHINIFLCY